MRAAKALKYFTSGQKNTLENVVGEGVFNEADLDPMNIVTVKNIDVYSLCEHHLIPFFGKVNFKLLFIQYRIFLLYRFIYHIPLVTKFWV